MNKEKREMSIKWKIIIAIGVLYVLMKLFPGEESHPGASMDWGDGYYWNSETEQVEETLW